MGNMGKQMCWLLGFFVFGWVFFKSLLLWKLTLILYMDVQS